MTDNTSLPFFWIFEVLFETFLHWTEIEDKLESTFSNSWLFFVAMEDKSLAADAKSSIWSSCSRFLFSKYSTLSDRNETLFRAILKSSWSAGGDGVEDDNFDGKFGSSKD